MILPLGLCASSATLARGQTNLLVVESSVLCLHRHGPYPSIVECPVMSRLPLLHNTCDLSLVYNGDTVLLARKDQLLQSAVVWSRVDNA